MNKLSEKLGLETEVFERNLSVENAWDIGAYAGTDAELLDMLSSSNGWDNDYDGGYVERNDPDGLTIVDKVHIDRKGCIIANKVDDELCTVGDYTFTKPGQ